MDNLLNKLEKWLPLYEISSKIKQQYLDAYDNQFYKQIRFCNISASTLYTLINVYEIYGGVSGMYLVFDVIFVSIGVFVLLGVLYAHVT
jgi:sensor histidine kinase YesM